MTGSESVIEIGHYDPGMKKILFYPELIPENEVKVIERFAMLKRSDSVHKFKMYDYDADVITDLHKKHREVLLEDGLIYKIAERYNNLPAIQKTPSMPEYLIDDKTSMYVGLRRWLGAYDKDTPYDTAISIVLHGDLVRYKGTLKRQVPSTIQVGSINIDHPDTMYKSEADIITDDEFTKLLELGRELIDLRANSQPNLDLKIVALKNK
jgi:hypothetical protein